MKKEFLLLVLFLVVVYIYAISVFGASSYSTSREFNVTPNAIVLNLTNTPSAFSQNITIGANVSNPGNIDILVNDSSRLSENYSQTGSTACQSNFIIFSKNTSGEVNNTAYSLSPGSSTNFTLVFNVSSSTLGSCKPGRYYTNNFVIRNITNSTENLNISITVDIPISSNNSQNTNLPTTGIASFNGQLPGNATTYQSYYFNTSEVANATSVYINVTWTNSSKDIDLFLFDSSGVLLEKSINKAAANETLFYNFLPSSPAVYEIRIYGNSTTAIPYNGNVIFSTLDSTNRTLDFGAVNASTINSQTFVLNDTGNLNLSNVRESKDLYYVKRFSNSGTKNFTFLVPDSTIASKFKVTLNWTGATNYSLYLYNPSEVLVTSSSNKYQNSNISNAMQEEYLEASITKGIWRAEVIKNNVVSADTYTLTVYEYVANPSDWINTSFTTTNFNGTSYQNYINNQTVYFNLTIPNKTMDGIYEGYLRYVSSSTHFINIPISTNVTTPMIVVNNSIESGTFTLNENYGSNITRSIIVQVNNTGSYDSAVTITNSSNLTCNVVFGSGCSGYNVTFVRNSFTNIGSNNYQNLTVNVTLNSSMPRGVYDGWIFINATNETENISSHPYRTFNLTFRVNLTNDLIIRTIVATSSDGDSVFNSTTAENITIRTIVSYINGTNVTDLYLNYIDSTDLTKNFTGVWLYEPNASYRYPVTGSLKIFNGTNPIDYCDGYSGKCYSINAEIPKDTSAIPGGMYGVYVDVSHKVDAFDYTGYGNGAYITINNTGAFMSTNVSGCLFDSSCPAGSVSMLNQTDYYIYAKINNFGTNYSTVNIAYYENCTGYTVVADSSTNCTSLTISGLNYTVTPPSYGSCFVRWKVTSGSSSTDACVSNLLASPSVRWFNPLGVNISISVSSTSTPSTTDTPTPVETPTTTSNLEFRTYEPLVIVQQNSSNYTDIGIKNTGSTTLDVTFSIGEINPVWYSLNATNKMMGPGSTAGFRTSFTIGMEEVKDYAGTYKASSSAKSITQNFILRVTPAPATQVVINTTLDQYKLNMLQLEDEINQSRNKNMNVSIAEQKLAELKSKIAEAENFIAQGDYFNANQLLDTIKNLVEETRNELSKAKETVSKERNKRIWIYVGIGAGIIVLGVAVYLFWPTKSSEGIQFKNIKPSKKEIDFEKLKEKYKKDSEQNV